MNPPRYFATVFAALSAFIFVHAAPADDLEDLEGTWGVESAEVGGKKIESGDLKELIVTIKGAPYEVLADLSESLCFGGLVRL